MSKRFIQRLNFDELRWETQTRVLSCRDLVMYEHRVLHPNNTNQFQTSLIFHITDSKKMLEAANEENLHWHSFLSPMFDSCSLEPQRALGDNTIPSAAAALLLSWWDFFSLQREIKEKFPFTTSRIRPAAGYCGSQEDSWRSWVSVCFCQHPIKVCIWNTIRAWLIIKLQKNIFKIVCIISNNWINTYTWVWFIFKVELYWSLPGGMTVWQQHRPQKLQIITTRSRRNQDIKCRKEWFDPSSNTMVPNLGVESSLVTHTMLISRSTWWLFDMKFTKEKRADDLDADRYL